MAINPFGVCVLRPSLQTIIDKGKYPCYADEVETMRQQRMVCRLEWRRKQADTMAKNRVIKWLWRVGFTFMWMLVLFLFSEALRLLVWTVLR